MRQRLQEHCYAIGLPVTQKAGSSPVTPANSAQFATFCISANGKARTHQMNI